MMDVAEKFELLKFQTVVNIGAGDGKLNLLCFEFLNQLMVFVTESPLIGTMIEAVPDDPVKLGNSITYSVTTVFGKEDLSLHLLARRLVEVLQRRLVLAVSVRSLENETIRIIEDTVSRLIKDQPLICSSVQ